MTRLHEQITTTTSIEEAFDFAADFANIEDWDPGVAESSQIGTGEVEVGTAFDVLVAFGNRRVPMVYTITEFDRPNRVLLVGEGDTLTAVDEITFAAVDGGTEITYTADLTFTGVVRFLVPFMSRVLDNVGRKAVAGLSAALASRRTAAS